MIIALIVTLIIFISLSAFFSGCETGLYSVSKVRVNVGLEQKGKNYRPLAVVISEPEQLIYTILTGNNIATFVVSWIGTYLFNRYSPSHAELLNTCIAAPTLFILGEVVPKTLFFLRPESLMLGCARLLLILHRITSASGICNLFKSVSLAFEKSLGISRENKYYTIQSKITKIFDATIEEGYLSKVQRNIIARTTTITNKTISQVMVDIKDVVSININSSQEEILELLTKYPYTRLPVYRVNKNDFAGYINVYKALSSCPEAFSIAGQMKRISIYDHNDSVISTLNRMQENGDKIALVGKKDSRKEMVLGLVTIKDLAEELTGELEVF